MIEKQIIQGLLTDEEYTRTVIPFLKSEYFVQSEQRLVFQTFSDYFEKYNTLPTHSAIVIDISQRNNVEEKTINSATSLGESIDTEAKIDDRLSDQTETFWKDKAN